MKQIISNEDGNSKFRQNTLTVKVLVLFTIRNEVKLVIRLKMNLTVRKQFNESEFEPVISKSKTPFQLVNIFYQMTNDLLSFMREPILW